MSESVEILDAAVEAADRAFWEHPASHGQNAAARNRAIRAALVAARPYLMPTAEQIAETLKEAYSAEDTYPVTWEQAADAVLALLNGAES